MFLNMAANGEGFRQAPAIGAAFATRMSRWSKNGALERIFKRLQQERMPRLRLDAVSLDSAVIKVHPDGTGALKKTVRSRPENPAEDGRRNCAGLPQAAAAR
jgi:hypothetical protein